MAIPEKSTDGPRTVSRLNMVGIELAALYISIYIVLSFYGEYSHPLSTGKYPHFHNPALSFPDSCIWQPAGMMVRPKVSNSNALAVVYFPLVSLDRRLWHPDVITFHGGK